MVSRQEREDNKKRICCYCDKQYNSFRGRCYCEVRHEVVNNGGYLVYFVQNIKNKSIKIGISIDLKARMYKFKGVDVSELKILGVIYGKKKDIIKKEKKLLKLFKEYNIEKKWFAENKRLINYIKVYSKNYEYSNLKFSFDLVEDKIKKYKEYFYIITLENLRNNRKKVLAKKKKILLKKSNKIFKERERRKNLDVKMNLYFKNKK